MKQRIFFISDFLIDLIGNSFVDDDVAEQAGKHQNQWSAQDYVVVHVTGEEANSKNHSTD